MMEGSDSTMSSSGSSAGKSVICLFFADITTKSYSLARMS